MTARVRCGICFRLLYDPDTREHFLEEDADGVNHCPGCGAVYSLLKVVKRANEPDEEYE